MGEIWQVEETTLIDCLIFLTATGIMSWNTLPYPPSPVCVWLFSQAIIEYDRKYSFTEKSRSSTILGCRFTRWHHLYLKRRKEGLSKESTIYFHLQSCKKQRKRQLDLVKKQAAVEFRSWSSPLVGEFHLCSTSTSGSSSFLPPAPCRCGTTLQW